MLYFLSPSQKVQPDLFKDWTGSTSHRPNVFVHTLEALRAGRTILYPYKGVKATYLHAIITSLHPTNVSDQYLLYEAHIALKGVCTVHARRSTSTSCRRAINSLLSCSSSSSSPAPFTPRDLFEKKAIKWQCHWQENTRVWVGVCVCGWRAQS